MYSFLTRALNLVQSPCFFLSLVILPEVNKRLLFVCSFLFCFALLEANIPYLPTKVFLIMEECELVPQFVQGPHLTSDTVEKKWGRISFHSVSSLSTVVSRYASNKLLCLQSFITMSL